MRLLFALLALLPSVTFADPVRLRIGTMAPEGSAWAREMHSFSREVSTLTDGQVELKGLKTIQTQVEEAGPVFDQQRTNGFGAEPRSS